MFFRRPSCFKVCQPKLRPAISPVDMSLIQWAGFQVTAEDFTSALGHTGRSKGNLIQGRTILRKSSWKGDPWDTRPERTRAQTLQVALLVYPYPLKNGIWGGESYWNFILKFHFCNHAFSMINILHHSIWGVWSLSQGFQAKRSGIRQVGFVPPALPLYRGRDTGVEEHIAAVSWFSATQSSVSNRARWSLFCRRYQVVLHTSYQ